MSAQPKVDTLDVTVEASALAAVLKPICAVVSHRTSMPILSTVKLWSVSDGLFVIGTDLDIEISGRVDMISGGGEWSACVDARALQQIAMASRGSALVISPVSINDSAGIKITAANGEYEVFTQDAAVFPEMKGKREGLIEAFTNGHLSVALSRVSSCISTDEARYYLNGVLWEASAIDRRFVATDGHRLIAHRYANEPNKKPWQRILPVGLVSLLCRHFGGEDVSVYATGDELKIAVVSGPFEIRAKIIEGTYPDYTRVIPKIEGKELTVSVPKASLQQAIKRATVFRHKFYLPAIRLFNEAGAVAASVRSVDVGKSTVIAGGGWPVTHQVQEIGFNSRYLKQMIQTCSGDITIRQKEAGSPLTLSDDDESMTRVLMPMRI